MNQVMSKIEFLVFVRKKWAEKVADVHKRFGIIVPTPKRIEYTTNRGFLARVTCSQIEVVLLEINEKCLLPENREHFLATTIPHEFAHAWNAAKGTGDGHGPNWQTCMRLLGVFPSRCGEWPSDKSRQKGMRPVCSNSNLIDLNAY